MSEDRSNTGTSKRKSVKQEEFDESNETLSPGLTPGKRSPPKKPSTSKKQSTSAMPDLVVKDERPSPTTSGATRSDYQRGQQADAIPAAIQNDEDVVYEGGLLNIEDDCDYKLVYDSKLEPTFINSPGNDVEIEVRGVKYKIPYAINCHLCNDLMNLCIRRTRYRGQPKEYPAYRCNRKGCQTFRSVKKVFNHWKNEKASENQTPDNFNMTTAFTYSSSSIQPSSAMVVRAPAATAVAAAGASASSSASAATAAEASKPAINHRVIAGKSKDKRRDSETDDEMYENGDDTMPGEEPDYLIRRVNIPRFARTFDESMKPMTMTDRMKLANQERAIAFSEFSDQLRRDIAANKRIKMKRHRLDDDDDQGTLLYISKELTAHEIIQLQDSISKILMNMRKMPTPMSVHDLPLFAFCPWSQEQVQRGMHNEKSLEAFCSAFTKAPQPPLPPGFVRRKDDTLIYRNPEPFEVPEILRENSPRKTAEAIVNYQLRKDVQEARKYEKRFSEKRYRAWKTLKRDFDSVENPCSPDYEKMDLDDSYDSAEEKRRRSVTLQHLMERMEEKNAIRSKIRKGCGPDDSLAKDMSQKMRWIDGGMASPPKLARTALSSEYDRKKGEMTSLSLHDMMVKSLMTPSGLLKPQPQSQLPKNPDGATDNYRDQSSSKDAEGLPATTSAMMFPEYQYTQENHQQHYFIDHRNSTAPTNYDYGAPMPPLPQPHPSQQCSTENVPVTMAQPNIIHQQGYHYMQPPTTIGTSSLGNDSNYLTPYTYVHPHSGVSLTDPSMFLNTFIPSPMTKDAPMNFGEVEKEPKVVSPSPPIVAVAVAKVEEISAPLDYAAEEEVVSTNEAPENTVIAETCATEELKVADASLKFDPPTVA